MKKIFTFLSAVLLTVGAAYSQQEQPAFSVAASALNPTNAKVESVVNFSKTAVSSTAKLPGISDIISVAPEGEEKIYYRQAFYMDGQKPVYQKIDGEQLRLTFAPDGKTVYFRDITCNSYSGDSHNYPDGTWLKGTIEGDQIILELPQALYSYGSMMCYSIVVNPVLEADIDGNMMFNFVPDFEPSKYVFDYKDGVLSTPKEFKAQLLGVAATMGGQTIWYGIGDGNYTYTELTETPVEIPADAVVEEYSMSYEENGTAAAQLVSVAKVGDDFYIKGFNPILPEATMKGSLNAEGKVEFPIQILAVPSERTYYAVDKQIYYLYPYTVETVDEVETKVAQEKITFDYDAETGKLTSADTFAFNIGRNFYNNPSKVYASPVLNKMTGADQIPAAPQVVNFTPYASGSGYGMITVSIPKTDVDGVALDTNNLYWQLEADGEVMTLSTDDYWELADDMVEVPVTFEDDWDIDILSNGNVAISFYVSPSESIGIRSVYYNKSGNRTVSAINLVDPQGNAITSGVDDVVASKSSNPVNVEYFDVLGRKAQEAIKNGVSIMRVTYKDGKVESRKYLSK
ncbi:MAG: hypothetical protein ACI4A8_03320 [Muribaculaceae bacterium]